MLRFRFSGAGTRLAACLAAWTALPLSANAELRVCNQTLNLYNVAVGYFQGVHCHPTDPLLRSACRLQTRGWWNLPANGCVTPVKEPLDQTYYYVFALDIYGNDAITGTTPLCVNVTKGFGIEVPYLDVEQNTPRCWQRGYQQVKFKEIDAGGAADWTVFVNQGEAE